jgi:hypothetical protein
MIQKMAGGLWVDRQDKEASYLRDVILPPIASKHVAALDCAQKSGAGFHSCTLTGLHP